jgi:hypothetical protein
VLLVAPEPPLLELFELDCELFVLVPAAAHATAIISPVEIEKVSARSLGLYFRMATR